MVNPIGLMNGDGRFDDWIYIFILKIDEKPLYV
jgi:hypothetical protein